MEKDEAFKSLLESCSVYGLFRTLKALDEKGMMTASAVSRVAELGSHAQAKKYLTFAMGLMAVTTSRKPVSNGLGAVLAIHYGITKDGRDFLGFLKHFDMAKTRLKEPIQISPPRSGQAARGS